MPKEYEVEFPAYLDGYELETEAKGYLVDVLLRSGAQQWNLTVYDPVRLEQEIADEIRGSAYFAQSRLLVVPTVTRDAINAAVAELAKSGFADFE